MLVVAPTRELAAQLARDASQLLDTLPTTKSPSEGEGRGGDYAAAAVLLAVQGTPPSTPREMSTATVLVGTLNELHAVLTRISGARSFVAGNALCAMVLDEVDVLLPPEPMALRTSFDGRSNSAQKERKARERRRKLRAAQRRGVEFRGGSSVKGKSSIDSSRDAVQVLTPTERVRGLVASARYVGGDGSGLLRVMAGSATASRATLDRLNGALRRGATEGGSWGFRRRTCTR